MSDATIANIIIGTVGVVGVVGSLATSYIVARMSRQTTKIQIEARQEEQAKQLEFETNKMIITRKIAERKMWIEPLRQSLTEYSVCASRAYGKLTNLGEFPEDFQNIRDVIGDPDYQELSMITYDWGKSCEELPNYIARISDPNLNKIINALLKIPIGVTASQIINKEKFLSSIERVKTAKNNVAAAFNRIEELLSGESE